MNNLLKKIAENPEKKDILFFLENNDENTLEKLFSYADFIRIENVGNFLKLRAIIEFSNYCSANCLYCGIRRSNRKITRYRMSEDEILCAAEEAKNAGFKIVILQSGEDTFYTVEKMALIIKRLVSELEINVTLAIGERSDDELKKLFSSGAHRFLLKHETCDCQNYSRLHEGSDFQIRLECLKSLKRIGFHTGSGVMIGLPGQTLESLADDLLLFRSLDLEMVGSGPFIPHPETPLSNYTPGDFLLSLKFLALTRLVLPRADIPATTALSTINTNSGRIKALRSGANVIMLNATPEKYRSLYDIYPNKKRKTSVLENELKEIERIAQDLGLKLEFAS